MLILCKICRFYSGRDQIAVNVSENKNYFRVAFLFSQFKKVIKSPKSNIYYIIILRATSHRRRQCLSHLKQNKSC